MSDSLDTLPYHRFRLSKEQRGIISVHYSRPQTVVHEHCATTDGPVLLFPNSETTWQALRGAEPHPFTQGMIDAAIKDGTTLWTCLPPTFSQNWSITTTNVFRNRVYFEVLEDDTGSCSQRNPSEPAIPVPDHPGKFMYLTKGEAKQRFGDLKAIDTAAGQGDSATKYSLFRIDSEGKKEYVGLFGVSLFPDSPTPFGGAPSVKRKCKISPWETAVGDDSSQQRGYVVEED